MISFHLLPTRDRVDLLAAGAGLLAIPAALGVAYAGVFEINVGMILLSALAVLASLGAFLAALFGGSHFPSELAPALAARQGVRAGLLTVLLGGATIVFLGTLLSLGLMGSSFFAIPAAAALLPILALMVLPVLLAAMVFGWLGGWLESHGRGSPPSEGPDPEMAGNSGDSQIQPAWWKSALPYILLLSGICYASPLVSLLLPAPTEPPPPAEPPPVPIQPISPSSYRYEMPAGFIDAPASRITIIKRERFPGALTDAPIRISPDSQLLAFCRPNLGRFSVVVIRLDDRQQVASLNLREVPTGLAWSQDSKRVVYLTRDTPRSAGVLFLEDGSDVKLPIPHGERLPSEAELVWPFEKEVVIIAPNHDHAYLDLDTLRVHPLTASKQWPGLTEEQKETHYAVARGDYYSNKRWFVAAHEQVTFYKPPNQFLQGWIQRTAIQMAAKDEEFAYSRLLSLGALRSGERLIATPERSIFIRLHEGGAQFLYFGLREEPELRTSFERSEVFPGDTVPPELQSHLEDKTLAAFICPPVINPLNDQVVGPDRRRIRGLARMAMTETGMVEFWISEEYEPVREGDVVADLHYWSSGEPHSLGVPGLEDWWTPMPPFAPLQPGLAVKREDVPKRSDPYRASPKPLDPSKPPASTDPADQTPEAIIEAFIVEHHRKVSRRDLEGLAADYAPKVDYFVHEGVTPDFIVEDQKKYGLKYSKGISETVRGRIAIKRTGDRTYEALYRLRSSLFGEEEFRWTEIQSEVRASILFEKGVPLIVAQHGTQLKIQHGEP